MCWPFWLILISTNEVTKSWHFCVVKKHLLKTAEKEEKTTNKENNQKIKKQ